MGKMNNIPEKGIDCKGIIYYKVEPSSRMADLSKTKFGRLQPLFTVKRENNNLKHWLCLCDCGNLKVVLPSNLTSNHICSCGCIRSETTSKRITEINNSRRLDLRNQVFGFLLVLDEEPEIKENTCHYYWKCLCKNCGKITKVRTDNLTSGDIIYCSYCNKNISQGERKIASILTENNINFTSQKCFDSCRFPDTNFVAKFDFYVEDKYIIEFDGKQHFKSDENYYFNTAKIKEHDKIKNKWCFENNIPIIRIPYYYLNKITIDDLRLTISTFIVKENESV